MSLPVLSRPAIGSRTVNSRAAVASSQIRTAIVIGEFFIEYFGWPASSVIVFNCPVTLSSPASLQLPLNPITDPSFCLAVKWQDVQYDVPVRRKLWHDITERLHYPVYAGERLSANFVIEVWTVEYYDQIINPSEIIIPTSIRRPQISYDESGYDLITPSIVQIDYPINSLS